MTKIYDPYGVPMCKNHRQTYCLPSCNGVICVIDELKKQPMSIVHSIGQEVKENEMANNKTAVRELITDCCRKRCPDITLQEIDELVDSIHNIYSEKVNDE